jgi:transposase, IS30 family
MDYTHLTFEQRYHIELGWRKGLAREVIARRIGVNRSTVYRELDRGKDPDGDYCAARADELARARANSSAANHPVKSAALWHWVSGCLRQESSPDQVVGRLAQVCPSASVSAPAIYAFVHRDERAGGELHTYLRYARKRTLRRHHPGTGMPRNRPSIRHRPKHIQSRQQPGHWEADTMLGNHRHPARVLATVERTSRYTQLGLLPQGGKAAHTARVLRRILTSHKVRSITFDNGSEFAHYERACEALGANPYFAEPARPGQRGSCENTIGLIRQYLPKYQSLAKLTADKLNWIQDRLNHRPRKCLGYLTPYEVLFNLKPTPVALRT